MKAESRNKLRLVVVVTVGAILGACPGTSPSTSPTPAQPADNVTPSPLQPLLTPAQLQAQDSLCNKADAQLALDRGLDSNAVNFARANGYYGWCIPEYDDDQRWWDGGNGNEYGPIAHVLAAPWLDTLSFTRTYRQVAIIEIDPETAQRPDPYKDMRLAGQFNCLYLRLSGGSAAAPNYDAVIVGPSGSLKCPDVAVDSGGPGLRVFVDEKFSDDPRDYPPTTRFVEGQGKRTLVGVKCANRWCVVGPPGSGSPMPLSAHHTVTPLLTHAQGRVKGWFDDQILGIPDGVGKYKIHRRNRASAVPDPNLGALTVAQFLVDSGLQRYKTVGRVWFDSEPNHESKYYKLFGFSQGLNIIGSRAEVHGPSKGDTVWFTQVINANGVTKNDIPTNRMSHRKFFLQLYGEKATIPATMRWRWFDQDEDLWYECDLGCCLAGKGA